MSFPGFRRPHANFYRLPNDWFDLWREVRAGLGRTRVLGVLKTTEYVIKWTWGYQNFDQPIHLTWLDFQGGRREGSRRLDLGTGLSSRSLQQALTLAVELGLLEKHAGEAGAATYLPHLRPPEQDDAGLLEGSAHAAAPGFAPPTANYFLVPSGWTDLAADVHSDTLLLTISYFFRHTWGWQSGRQVPCWLSEDEIAQGRCCPPDESFQERYDCGTGYSTRAVRDALNEGERRRWLVWRRQGGRRLHVLHLAGMTVGEDGQLQTVTEQSKVPGWNEVKCPLEQSKVAVGTKYSAPYIGITDNPIQTITTDNGCGAGSAVRSRALAAVLPTLPAEPSPPQTVLAVQGKEPGLPVPGCQPQRQTVSALQEEESDLALPADLQERLTALAFQGQGPLAELRAAYTLDPDRIRRWIDHLAATRAGDPHAGGFLLQVVVREQAPAPGVAVLQETTTSEACSFCRGAGSLLVLVAADDPQHKLRLPCPRCRQGTT